MIRRRTSYWLVLIAASCAVGCSRQERQLRFELTALSESSGLVVGNFSSNFLYDPATAAKFFRPNGALVFENRIMAGRKVIFVRSSPRGDRLIWVDFQDGISLIVITDVDGNRLWEVPGHEDTWMSTLALSNDNTRLAFQSSCGLTSVDIASKKTTVLVHGKDFKEDRWSTIGWSPGADRIVYEDAGHG